MLLLVCAQIDLRAQVVVVDVGATSAGSYTTGGQWNYYLNSQINTTQSNLVDIFGNNSGYSLTTTSWSTAVTNNLTGSAWDGVGSIDWVEENAALTSFYTPVSATRTVTIGGLDNSSSYYIQYAAVRSTSSSARIADYSIGGVYGVTGDAGQPTSQQFSAHTDGYDNGILFEWTSVSSNASGNIVIDVAANSGDYGYITAIKISGSNVWTGASNDRYNVTGNWLNNTVPNAVGAWANFLDQGTERNVRRTGADPTSFTVGNVLIDDDSAYTIGSSTASDNYTLTLDNTGSTDARLQVQNLNGEASHVIEADLDLQDNLIVDNEMTGGSSLSLNGDLETNGNNITLEGDGDISIAGAITQASGTAAFTTNNLGTVTLTGSSANTYTGTTTINSGTLVLDKASSGTNAIAGAITVTSGATLRLAESEQIAGTSDLTLSGGTFELGGFNETLDNLTLTANSVIDFNGGDSVLTFTGSSIDLSTHTLSIWNWQGAPVIGDGNDQLIFSHTLTLSELSQIRFYKDSGVTSWFETAPLWSIKQLGDGEIVPAPEPSTLLGIGGLLGLITWHLYRRRYIGRRRAKLKRVRHPLGS